MPHVGRDSRRAARANRIGRSARAQNDPGIRESRSGLAVAASGARPGIAAPPVVLGVYRGGGQVIQGRNIANQAIEIGTDTCDRAPVRVGHVDATLRRLSGDGRHAALRDRVALDDRIARAQPNLDAGRPGVADRVAGNLGIG